MHIDAITIFPEYFSPLSCSLLGKAQEAGLLSVGVHDLRDHTDDRHRTVDDTPYGGGPGMVMLPEPWGRALDVLTKATETYGVAPQLIVPTPGGRLFTQRHAEYFAEQPWLIFACGRYEGIDNRVAEYARESMPVHEVSIGEYVLAGGEVASLTMIEAITRLIPGVVGNAESVRDDSFSLEREGLVEAPVYTRPRVWRERSVPDILLSGNHAAIDEWRHARSLERSEGRGSADPALG